MWINWRLGGGKSLKKHRILSQHQNSESEEQKKQTEEKNSRKKRQSSNESEIKEKPKHTWDDQNQVWQGD